MEFEDDRPIQCDACGEFIYAGSKYNKLKLNGKAYRCCFTEKCCSKLLFDLFESEFEECRLYTAEENADIWADMR